MLTRCSTHLSSSTTAAASGRGGATPCGAAAAPPRRPTPPAAHRAAVHRRGVAVRAEPTSALEATMPRLADYVSGHTRDMEEEERFGLERLAVAIGEPVGVAKNMAFKRRGLLALTPDEIASRLQRIAEIVEVSVEKARRMAVIQPVLLLETEVQAKTLAGGLKSICYELGAPKDEIVELIIENQSVLHGRQLHLSVADIAHLSILREPKGRIVD